MTIDASSEGSSQRASSLAPGRRRSWLSHLLAMLLGILAAGLAAEVTLRATGVSAETRGHFRPGIYIPDDELGWALRPGYEGIYLQDDQSTPIHVNEMGYRTPTWDEARRRSQLRILALGDSCTFGLGVHDTETYPAQLERVLRLQGRDAAVFDAGVPGYDTVQEASAFRRLLDVVQPKVVVIGWLRNDVQVTAEEQAAIFVHEGQLVGDEEDYREWRRRVDHQGIHASLAYRCFRLWQRRLKEAAGVRRNARGAETEIAPENLRASQQALVEVVDGARARGARVVLVLIPRKEEVQDDALDLDHHEDMRAWAAGQGVDVVDLATVWRAAGRDQGRYLLRDSVHLTPLGYGQVAQAIADAIR